MGRDGEIVVHGSARLVQTLVEHDLVDEFRLMVYPVVLGSGKRLFGETSDKRSTSPRTPHGNDEFSTAERSL